MSADQNGEGSGSSKQKIGSSLYPSLTGSQLHDETSLTMGSPTVPHPIFEGVSHPISPIPLYSYRSMPMESRDGGEFVPLSYHNPTNTSDIYQFNVASNDQGATPDQPRIDTSESGNQRTGWPKICCSRICWLVSVFFILLVNAAVSAYYLFT